MQPTRRDLLIGSALLTRAHCLAATKPDLQFPTAARDRIAADIRAVASDPVVLARLTATGQVAAPGTAAEFAASIEEQRGKLAAVAQQLGIKAAQ